MTRTSSPSRGLLSSALPTATAALAAIAVLAASALSPASAATRDRSSGAAHPSGRHAHRAPRPEVTRAQAVRALQRAQALRERHPGQITAADPTGIDATQRLLALRTALPELTEAEQAQAQGLLNRPASGSAPTVDCTTFPHFCLHYSTANTTADQRALTGETLEQVWSSEVDSLGYRAPLGDAGESAPAGVNPDGKFDVYLTDVGAKGYFGYCAPDSETATQSPAYCVLDNDFSSAQFGGADPLTSLQATAAHEFFHAVQFAYDTYQDRWLMEGSAVWMEDTVFPAANDYLRYVGTSSIRQPAVPVDLQSFNTEALHVYGSFLLFRYLSDRFGVGIVKEMWDSATSTYGSALVRSVVARRASWTSVFGLFAAHNTEPATSYADGAAYGSAPVKGTVVLSRRHRSSRLLGPERGLLHLSSAALRVVPGAGAAGRRLQVQVRTPGPGHFPAAVLVRHYTDGTADYTPIGLRGRSSGTGRVVSPIAANLAYATVVLANASTAMSGCGRDSAATYSCAGIPVDDGRPYAVRVRLR